MTASPVDRIRELGGELFLVGDRLKYRIPAGNLEARQLIAKIRRDRAAVIAMLRDHESKPPSLEEVKAALPAGVRLFSWNLKDPPVAIETCAVVTDPALFARSTLEQLRVALENPKRWVGWSVPQLIDRLAQVGAIVALK